MPDFLDLALSGARPGQGQIKRSGEFSNVTSGAFYSAIDTDIMRARIFAICCKYEDADDLDTLRDDPGFRVALGKFLGAGGQPTDHEPMGQLPDEPRTGTLDGGEDWLLLLQLHGRTQSGDAGYRLHL
jgi:hypothetical protein